MRNELGGTYVDTLRKLYEGRVTGSVDLVCYWFEKSRAHILANKTKRAGLLSTNSIRGGANREVLNRIKETGDIFMAWSDREWVLNGAAVRVSMIGFDKGIEETRTLDGKSVFSINPDLTSSVNITVAKKIQDNRLLSFIGPQKDGPLDIPNELALSMLNDKNASGLNNSDILKPYLNGNDIVDQSRHTWIVDFGTRTEAEAAKYEAPFKYMSDEVKPIRAKNNDRQRRENWWRLGRSGGDYRSAIQGLQRQIFTPRVAKHRIFVWVAINFFPDSAVVAIARDDDYFFGVLHSRLHELWALRMGTWLGVGNDPRYTPTTTFETFPFPWPPAHEDTASPAYQAVAAAAKQLHQERQAWLTSSPLPVLWGGVGGGVSGGGVDTPQVQQPKDRTLTNLYNALNVLKGVETIKTKPDAAAFAPRLLELHTALDQAVCDAYGWPHDILTNDDEILRRLLDLNLQRAAS